MIDTPSFVANIIGRYIPTIINHFKCKAPQCIYEPKLRSKSVWACKRVHLLEYQLIWFWCIYTRTSFKCFFFFKQLKRYSTTSNNVNHSHLNRNWHNVLMITKSHEQKYSKCNLEKSATKVLFLPKTDFFENYIIKQPVFPNHFVFYFKSMQCSSTYIIHRTPFGNTTESIWKSGFTQLCSIYSGKTWCG